MTRTLAQYVAAGYQTDGKTPNAALEGAKTLSLDRVEEAFLRGGAAEPAAAEPKEGSFERFMMTLGSNGGARPGQ